MWLHTHEAYLSYQVKAKCCVTCWSTTVYLLRLKGDTLWDTPDLHPQRSCSDREEHIHTNVEISSCVHWELEGLSIICFLWTPALRCSLGKIQSDSNTHTEKSFGKEPLESFCLRGSTGLCGESLNRDPDDTEKLQIVSYTWKCKATDGVTSADRFDY